MSFHSYGSVPYGLNNIFQRTKYQWYQWDPSLLSPASRPCAQSPPMNSLTVSWYSVSICRTSSWGSHPRQAPRNGSGLCLKSWLSEKFYIHVSVSYKVICLSIFQSNVFYDVSLLLSLVFPAELTTLTDEKNTCGQFITWPHCQMVGYISPFLLTYDIASSCVSLYWWLNPQINLSPLY